MPDIRKPIMYLKHTRQTKLSIRRDHALVRPTPVVNGPPLA